MTVFVPWARRARPVLLAAVAAVVAMQGAQAAPGDQPVKPLLPGAAAPTDVKGRTLSLPARGLFDGDRLSVMAQRQLVDLIVDAKGLNVEVALIVPTGPWRTDGRAAAPGTDERQLTGARLQALRSFLTERGVDPKRIFVESRIDEKIAEPRLDVQLLGRPASD